MNSPLATVVIPTYNRPSELSLCLEALHPEISQRAGVEVLVLDDGVTQQANESICAGFPWARWHTGPRRGPAANRNLGASLGKGSWVVFLDDDCLPRTGFLAAYFAAFQADPEGESSVFVGPTFNPGPRPSLLWEAPLNPNGAALISCNFALSRKVFSELGGFDERFPGAAFEDTDFEERARAAGLQVQFVPGAAVDHPFRRIPSARKLAGRWEARVISTLDLGASPRELHWRIPIHIMKVISSRFRGLSWDGAAGAAALVFAAELAWVLWLLPRWVRRHARGPRSPFWQGQVLTGRAPARFGL